jgi:aminoglycoside phosphotransferase (APT) family kinase protein
MARDVDAQKKARIDGVRIDATLVSRLVAAQFPRWADLPVRPVEHDGWDNTTFRLGEEMSARLPSAAPYAPQVDKEHRWLPKLAPLLPLPIPTPLAKGAPTEDYPFHWSVYRWIEGEPATVGRIDDTNEFATALADFLGALYRVDPADGPLPGPHNFFRGGPLAVYDAETRRAISVLDSEIDVDAASAVWEAALGTAWHGPPVPFHGDIAAGNLLVKDGRLGAVIDFGSSGVGDPSCDLAIAWTLLDDEGRAALRVALPLDDATWARGRGWALWKALITLAENVETNPREAQTSRRVIERVLADHAGPQAWTGARSR